MTEVENIGYRPEMPTKDRPMRIGDRVRVLIGDWFLDAGIEGLVVNIETPRPNRPPRCRVLWDEHDSGQQVCMVEATTIGIIREDGMRLCVEARDVLVGDTLHGRLGTVAGIVSDDDETELVLSGGQRITIGCGSHVWVDRPNYVPQPTGMGTFG